jgi:hypothetical protein
VIIRLRRKRNISRQADINNNNNNNIITIFRNNNNILIILSSNNNILINNISIFIAIFNNNNRKSRIKNINITTIHFLLNHIKNNITIISGRLRELVMGNGWTTVGEEVMMLEEVTRSLDKGRGKEDERGRLCGGRGARMLQGKLYSMKCLFPFPAYI